MADLIQSDHTRPPVTPAGVSKGWVPTEYMDEVCPACRPTPTDWIVAGDVPRLAQGWTDGPPERAICEGETVSFEELTSFPSVQAVWNGPGDYEVLSWVPEGATLFCLPGDPDTLGCSIAEFMRDNGEAGVFEFGEAIEIEAYDWSEAKFTLRGGRFVPEGEAANG